MPVSNFPNGFTDGISIRGVPLIQTHPGQVFWVGNSNVAYPGRKGASNSNRGTFLAPFATLDFAIGQCVAGCGDIIMVLPGHAESVAAASAVTCDIAGVAIIGLGQGTSRPTLTWTTAATSTVVVSAANISFSNFRFIANVADVTTMFSVTGAGDFLSFEGCLFTDTSTVLNAVDFITLATGADGLSLRNCQVIGASASNDSFITGVAHDGLFMSGCQIQFNVAQTAVVGLIESSGNWTNVWIHDCAFASNVDGALFLDFNGAANSGIVNNCNFSSADVAGAVTAGFDFTGGHMFECYVAGEADSYGIIGGGTAYNNA